MNKNAKTKKKNQDPTQAVGQMMMPLAVAISQGLRELVIDTGVSVVQQLLEDDRTELCGQRYQHDPERKAGRGGHAPSALPFGGRKVQFRRPRAIGKDGHEVPLPLWQQLAEHDPLDDRCCDARPAAELVARRLAEIPCVGAASGHIISAAPL